MTRFGVVIPTLNAEPWLDALLPALIAQTSQPADLLVIDSSSTDNGPQLWSEFGARVITITRAEFDHGGTRQLGAQLLGHLPIVMYLTQDALPKSPESFAKLLEAFADPRVGVAYGRQLPRLEARAIEAHARLFNYPIADRLDDASTLEARGIRASFCSNSFAAYRTQALDEVGGFPAGCIFGEDAVVAIRLMRAGWLKQYASSAEVLHSHEYNVVEEFKRYFDVGVLHSTSTEMINNAGGVGGEGGRFVRSEMAYLLKHEPLSIPSAVVRTLAKYSGYKLGNVHSRLPVAAARHLSMNRRFWRE